MLIAVFVLMLLAVFVLMDRVCAVGSGYSL